MRHYPTSAQLASLRLAYRGSAVPYQSYRSADHVSPLGGALPAERVHGIGEAAFRLVDTWNGGTREPRVVWTGKDEDGAFRWVIDHTPFSFHEATHRQGYRLEPIR